MPRYAKPPMNFCGPGSDGIHSEAGPSLGFVGKVAQGLNRANWASVFKLITPLKI